MSYAGDSQVAGASREPDPPQRVTRATASQTRPSVDYRESDGEAVEHEEQAAPATSRTRRTARAVNAERPRTRGEPPGTSSGAVTVQRRQPTLEGEALTVWYPTRSCITCPIPGCAGSFSAAVWTQSKQSLMRHLREMHDLVGLTTSVVCVGCEMTMGLRPGAHKCDRSIAADDEAVTVNRYKCREEECGRSFPSKQGLANHTRDHRRRVIAEAAAVVMPVPATRQRGGVPRTGRGGDPRIPEVMVIPPDASPPQRIATPVPPPIEPPPRVLRPAQTRVPTPVRPVEARLIAPPEPRRDSPRNEGYVVTYASPELWTPSPLASTQASDQGNNTEEVADSVVEDEEGSSDIDHPLRPDDTTAIHAHLPCVLEILAAPTTADTWDRFTGLVERITADAKAMAKIPDRPPRTNVRARVNVEDAEALQKLYRRNRRKAVRAIVGGDGVRCEIPVEEVEAHFRAVWAGTESDPTIYPSYDDRRPMPTGGFTAVEVEKRLKKFENTAPGDDGLTYRHWRLIDPRCALLTAIFSVCLKHRRVPGQWKSATTVLIHKKGDVGELGNWRPIALSRTIYKLYAGCLAKRLTAWLMENHAISPGQKGFLPADGAFEHVHTLQRTLERARTGRADKCVAWLDVSNAFGAVPHGSLVEAVRASGAGDVLADIIADIYRGAVSCVSSSDGVTGEIPVLSGIKQGCPLSGLLFIMAIDPVVRELQGQSEEHRVLAFADDLCIIGDSPPELQAAVRTAEEQLGRIALKVNAAKCASLHLSGITPVGARETVFTVAGGQMRTLSEGDAAVFLGVQVGFNIVPPMSTLADITDLGLRIVRSKLAPWQRLDALKTFFYPAATFSQRFSEFKKTDWETVDRIMRPEIKSTLGLPQEASNEYLYGSAAGGACAIRMLAEDADIAAVDSAFKLLTSPDRRVLADAWTHLKEVVSSKAGRPADVPLAGDFLSGSMDGDLASARSRTGVKSVWSNARNASRRINVTWNPEGDAVTIRRRGATMRPKQRHEVMKTLREELRMERSESLRAKPDQGRAMECVAAHRASSHFIRAGDYTRFADWRFIHRARLNLVALNGSASWRSGDRSCRRCGYITESLAHVVDHCWRYAAMYMARHNAVVARIKKAAEPKFEILSENQVIGSGGLRPDLVLRRDGRVYIVDVTIPAENRVASFKTAADGKRAKYEDLRAELAEANAGAVVYPVVVGALGSWDPSNDLLLQKLCARSYASLLRKLCVSEVIGYTRDIYIEHLTDVRQRQL
ncbi:uncharacterized protein LOC126833140 [Adelges cooleyi]|uniref:uncharacterized protein LOC126833140 n=1 Tax=Adelges cooleyi TaxID=133065 RepID=UPI00217FB6BB|nr:uncharacterized protein LOC126833140 [Adelges cooleyi]